MKPIWFAIGALSLALALLGAFLPLLPTVPFLLLAAFAFSKGSDGVHRWLLDHPRLGPPILDWRERGAISGRAKLLAILAMLASIGLSYFLGFDGRIVLLQTAILLVTAVFLLTRPSS